MNPFLSPAALLSRCVPFHLLLAAAGAGEPLPEIRKAAQAVVDEADIEATYKKLDLAKKYAVALDGLEKKLTAAGDLDGVVQVRAERTAVLENGETTSHAGKELEELRGKYRKGLEDIGGGVAAAKARALEQLRKTVRERESELTKAGKVEEALALRAQAEHLALEFGGGAGAGFREDPRTLEKAAASRLEPVEVPAEKPPVMADPFAQKDRWLESLTVPVAKERVREPLVIGDRGKKAWPLVVVSPGSHWVMGGDAHIDLSAGKFVSEGSRFDDLRFYSDLACNAYFIRCVLTDCVLTRGGIWWDGSEAAAKFYLQECLIRGGVLSPKGINIKDSGYRAERCVFENVELPSMVYRKKQPADVTTRKWLRFVNCRFTGCKIPVTFLYLTQDCIFENCTFTDGTEPPKPEEEAVVVKPFEVVLYTTGTKNKITRLPAPVKLTEKPVTALRGVVVPTAAELLRTAGP